MELSTPNNINQWLGFGLGWFGVYTPILLSHGFEFSNQNKYMKCEKFWHFFSKKERYLPTK